MRARILSIDQLRNDGGRWNELWEVSRSSLATLRREVLIRFVEQFSEPDRLRVVVVEADGHWRAGLPIVVHRLAGVLPVAYLPNNPWITSGNLLVADQPNNRDTLRALARALVELPVSAFCWEWVDMEGGSWSDLLEEMNALGKKWLRIEQFPVGVVRVTQPWEVYESRLSKNRRKQLNRQWRRLAECGRVEVVAVRPSSSRTEWSWALEQAWRIEHRTWKGGSGTSILASGLASFFDGIAQELAPAGCCELYLLNVAGRPIAFDFGFRSQGVYSSHKVSFDRQFAKYGPGQLLSYWLVRTLSNDPGCSEIDLVGEFDESSARWSTNIYWRHRLLIANRGMWGRVWISMRQWKQRLKRQLSRFGPARCSQPPLPPPLSRPAFTPSNCSGEGAADSNDGILDGQPGAASNSA